MNVFPENFRRYRLSQGMTQQQLADRLGKSQQAIGAYENGWRTPPAADIRAWEKKIPDFCRFDIMPEVFGKTPDEGWKVWNRVHGL